MLSKQEDFRREMSGDQGDDTLEEMYITLLEQKRKNRVLLSLMRNFTEDNTGMMFPVAEALENSGLKLAHRPQSSGSQSGRRPGTGGSRPGTGNSGFFPPVNDLPSSRSSRSRPGSRGSRSGRPDSSRSRG